MYPDLSYVFADLFGTPVDSGISIVKTYGILLVLAFLASAWILRLELRRKEETGQIPAKTVQVSPDHVSWGDVLMTALFCFLLGFKLPYIVGEFDVVKTSPIKEIFSLNGTLVPGFVLAGAAAVFMLFRKFNKGDENIRVSKVIHPVDRVAEITALAAVFGILGARLFVLWETWDDFLAFWSHPVDAIFSSSAMAVYGGIVVAFVGVLIYTRKIGMPSLNLMDAAAPAMLIGYAVGRMGCHFSGDGDWGIINTLPPPEWWFFPDWLWAYDYPHTVLRSLGDQSLNGLVPISDCGGYETVSGDPPKYCNRLREAVFPTPIYETVANLLIFFFLWSIRKRIRIAGMLFFIYMIFNGIERFFVEKIRVNEVQEYFGIQATQAEFISCIFFFVGIVGCFVLYLRNQKSIPKDV